MARPDLPDGFGGWQVVDATPQETSDGNTATLAFYTTSQLSEFAQCPIVTLNKINGG